MVEKDFLPGVGADGMRPSTRMREGDAESGQRAVFASPLTGRLTSLRDLILAVASEGVNPGGSYIGSNSRFTPEHVWIVECDQHRTVDAAGSRHQGNEHGIEAGSSALSVTVPPTREFEVFLENKRQSVMMLQAGALPWRAFITLTGLTGPEFTPGMTLISSTLPIRRRTNYTLMVQADPSGGTASFR